MLIGIVGKPSSGKSTMLNAICMTDAKMGEYPFTTIEANRGVGYVSVTCPCKNLEQSCDPKNGKCDDGNRLVPIEMLDVAGLVPGASKGNGMGNQFLDDLRRADVLIHVVDASGATDAEGNPTENYRPVNDITWLNEELAAWISNILFKDWDRICKRLDSDQSKLAEILQETVSGLGTNLFQIKEALKLSELDNVNPRDWKEKEKLVLASQIRENIMPIIIAGNKIDKPNAIENISQIISEYSDIDIVETTGLAELVLRKGNEKKWIKYFPGSTTFDIILKNKTDPKLNTILAIKKRILDKGKTTGVMKLLETCVFGVLELLAVFPVDDTTHLTDTDGRILPDVFLVQKGTTAKELAGKVHSDLAKAFIHGILANKSNKRISATYEVENGDIIKVLSAIK